MATFSELIDFKSSEALHNIIVEEESAREKSRLEWKEKHCFRNITEVIEYLKTNHIVSFSGETLMWDSENQEKPIKFIYQTSDGTDCVFWNTSKHYTIEEFKAKFNKGMDEYGYLPYLTKVFF